MGSGKRLNDIEKGQINAFKNLNLPISDIFRKVNRSRKVIRHYLNGGHTKTATKISKPIKNKKIKKP